MPQVVLKEHSSKKGERDSFFFFFALFLFSTSYVALYHFPYLREGLSSLGDMTTGLTDLQIDVGTLRISGVFLD